MAKQKGEVSKSQRIREYFTSNPKATARDVVEALSAEGIKVTGGLVYFVKGKMKGRKGRKKKATMKAVGMARSNGQTDAVATIKKVKQLASEVGGLSKLRSLVEVLSE